MAHVKISDVHAAAPSMAVAFLFAHEFRHCTVQMGFQCLLERIVFLAGKADSFCEFLKLLGAHCFEGVAFFCDTVSMPTMRAGNIVIRPQCRIGANGDPFLTD